ncbi:MAG: HipA domain-containing protein [Lachnospiraceae bacterium]|nr:HipA domain-containing protein [Lachnospiraceae bacterium]
MYYYLMRKNTPITVVEIDESGQLIWADYAGVSDERLLPLEHATDKNRLSFWWKYRAAPIKQKEVYAMLEKKGFDNSEIYLQNNLGLSLTDYYWIKPIDSGLSWEDVNLFDNEFQNEWTTDFTDESSSGKYSPNSSLQGALEKKWAIWNGKRYLIKGNKDNYSTESINEVIASRIHEEQGKFDYAKYNLTKINGKDYDYGCISPIFTSQDLELVSAYAIVTSEKQPNDISSYEHFINVCKKHGANEEILRANLEYQIQTDFILSNCDRHLNNVAILRNADTLEFKGMAPIFDSGKSLFVHQEIPDSTKALLSVRTTSFASTELQLMKYVTDRTLVDISKLLDRKTIAMDYSIDSQMSHKRIEDICDAYERKIELYRKFQLGEDLGKLKFSI